MTQYQSVLSAAFALDVSERRQLIDALAATVPDDAPPTLSPEWLEEINRRADEMESGKVQGIPLDEVLSDLNTMLKNRHGS